jgi:hypothetical protein
VFPTVSWLTGHSVGSAALTQIGWYAFGAVAAFLLPFAFSSVLDLNHDFYYSLYFAGASLLLIGYVSATGVDMVDLFKRSWRWSLLLGLLAAAFVVFNVLSRDSTARPDGAYFAFTIVWRGVLYGAIDALLLTAFPAAVAYALMNSRVDTVARRAGYAILTLVLVMVITATYHLGYEQFREDGIGPPEIGNSIISLPAVLTTNPLGSVIAHASMHVAADVHAYETEVFLPPKISAE